MSYASQKFDEILSDIKKMKVEDYLRLYESTSKVDDIFLFEFQDQVILHYLQPNFKGSEFNFTFENISITIANNESDSFFKSNDNSSLAA